MRLPSKSMLPYKMRLLNCLRVFLFYAASQDEAASHDEAATQDWAASQYVAAS